MNPEVSVLLPVWNRFHLLPETLRTIEAQTYRPLRVLAFDDGSTDGSVRVLRAWKTLGVEVEIVEGGINRGIHHARQVLGERFRTDLAVWLDSDDLWAPDKVETQVQVIQEFGLDCCFTDLHFFTEVPTFLSCPSLRPCTLVHWDPREVQSIRNGTTYTTAMFTREFGDLMFGNPEVLGWNDTVWNWGALRFHQRLGRIPLNLYGTRRHQDRWTLFERGEAGKSYLAWMRAEVAKSVEWLRRNTTPVPYRARWESFPIVGERVLTMVPA